ncbi:MAG: hypothetical protein ACI9N9_002468 [Enterobacterales bacterium]|jgi:hypothetical protein
MTKITGSNIIITQMKTFLDFAASILVNNQMNGVRTMILKRTKLRHLALGTQFFAGVALLTASYFTTDSGWDKDLLNAAVHSEQPAVDSTIKNVHQALAVNECS